MVLSPKEKFNIRISKALIINEIVQKKNSEQYVPFDSSRQYLDLLMYRSQGLHKPSQTLPSPALGVSCC
jgi:hypothetical protein